MIDKRAFAERRQKIMNAMIADSIAIVATNKEFNRSADADFPFRPNSDFYYLTGFVEPEAVAVFIPGREQGQYVLFNRERDPLAEQWVGRRAGQKGAVENYAADQAFSIHEFETMLADLMIGKETVYYSSGRDSQMDNLILKTINKIQRRVRAGVKAPQEIINFDTLVHPLRLIKSEQEIATMRRVGEISANAHLRAMKACRPGMSERQLEAELIHEFMSKGCANAAYNSIIGGGANACILHYIENNQSLKDGDLVLIDAGGELDFYAADITRTFPVNGKFTPQQTKLYQLVLQSQKAAIEVIKPGLPWSKIQETIVRVLVTGLVELGILKGDINKLIEEKAYFPFYMHNSGHWLGIDVHDVGSYKQDNQWRLLEPGMVLTVEPGLYISEDKSVDKQWWNIGIRIEDDVLVTNNGCEILTAAVPKEIHQIEAAMSH